MLLLFIALLFAGVALTKNQQRKNRIAFNCQPYTLRGLCSIPTFTIYHSIIDFPPPGTALSSLPNHSKTSDSIGRFIFYNNFIINILSSHFKKGYLYRIFRVVCSGSGTPLTDNTERTPTIFFDPLRRPFSATRKHLIRYLH